MIHKIEHCKVASTVPKQVLNCRDNILYNLLEVLPFFLFFLFCP